MGKKRKGKKKSPSSKSRRSPRRPETSTGTTAGGADQAPSASDAAASTAEPIGGSRRRPPLRLLLTAVLAVAFLVWLATGFERVIGGEIALIAGQGDAVAAVWQPGLHWRWPFGGEVRKLPAEPIELSREVSVQTAEGATVSLDMEGRFAVDPGRVEDWVAAAGWEPFVEALDVLSRETLTPAVQRIDPAALFRPAAEEALAIELGHGIEAAGGRAEAVVVRAPPDRNPVATAVLRNRVGELALPTGDKVLVIGWDGADWLMIRPLLEAGRLPNLERLMARGVSGELRSQKPLLSPLIWTTVATGKPVVEHGVADFLVEDPATGALAPIGSTYRKVHALWTLLGAFDLSTDVVAWWATWPAEPIQGRMITDRVAYQLFEVQETSAEGKVHPPALWGEIEPLLVPAEEVPFSEVQRYVDVERDELARRWAELPPERRQEDRLNHLRKILATTASYHRIGLELLAEQADLTLLYYEGTDTVGHLFARFLPPRMRGVSAEDVRRFGVALPEFYEHADELLGEILAAADPDTTVLLISDHGFFTGAARPASDPSDFAEGAPQWHRLHGVLVAAGPGIRPGTVEGATVLDIAPTVLARLGLPVPEDMPGQVLEAIVPAAGRSLRPDGERLASYEILPRSRPARVDGGGEMDEERLRELVALGYISPQVLEDRRTREASGDASAATRRAAAATGTVGDGGSSGGDFQAISTEAYNLGRILQRQGKIAEAEEQFRLAVERSPDFGQGWASLAQVASQSGRHGEALDRLIEGFGKSRSMPMAAITGLVDEAKEAGRLDGAERALRRLGEPYRSTSAYPAALGLLAEARGRAAEALDLYERALAIDPLDQLAIEQTVSLLRRSGRESEARAFLDRTSQLASGQVDAANYLAVVALRQGWPVEAERLLRRVLESDPGNPGVLANLAGALAQQGRRGEAITVMQSAIEREPDNARNHFNLGAMLAGQGRLREALAAFEQAEEHGLRSARLHVSMSKMRFRLGDLEGAERELVRALELEPGDPEARSMLQALRTAGP